MRIGGFGQPYYTNIEEFLSGLTIDVVISLSSHYNAGNFITVAEFYSDDILDSTRGSRIECIEAIMEWLGYRISEDVKTAALFINGESEWLAFTEA